MMHMNGLTGMHDREGCDDGEIETGFELVV